MKINAQRYLGDGHFSPMEFDLDYEPTDGELPREEEYRRMGFSKYSNLELGVRDGYGLTVRTQGSDPGMVPLDLSKYLVELSDGESDDYIFVADKILLMDLLRWMRPAFEMINQSSQLGITHRERIVQVIGGPEEETYGLDASGELYEMLRSCKYPGHSNMGMHWCPCDINRFEREM